MRLLLDTHALLWWILDEPRLSSAARAAIRDPDSTVWVSAVSAYEITQKHRRGKLPQSSHLARAFEAEIAAEGFVGLPISVAEAKLAGQIEHAHRDPFDRLLIAQALLNDLTLVSNETLFGGFGVSRFW